MGRGVCRGGGVKKTAGKCVQIRKGGAREPENPCRDNGTVPGGGENGSVQRAGASAEEKRDPSAWKELVCSQGVHGEGGGVRGKGGSVHASEVGARLRGPVLGMGPGSARRR